jgi:hypothetical protein
LREGSQDEGAICNCAAQPPGYLIECDLAMLFDGLGKGLRLQFKSFEAKLPKRLRVFWAQFSDFNL